MDSRDVYADRRGSPAVCGKPLSIYIDLLFVCRESRRVPVGSKPICTDPLHVCIESMQLRDQTEYFDADPR